MPKQTVFNGRVAGPSFYPDGKNCRVNEEVTVVPEPDNKYDAQAIAVLSNDGKKIGHIPMVSTGVLHKHWAQGRKLSAVLTTWQWPNRCAIKVTLA